MKLSDACTMIMGQSPASSSYNNDGKGLPFYQGNADFGEIHPTPKTWCTEPKKTAEAGDILISVRAPIGAINIANERCCIGRGLAAIRPTRSEVSRDYLVHMLQANRKKLEAMGTGSTFKAVGKRALFEYLVPIYESDKQTEIALHLESVLSCVKNGNEQLQLLDQLVKSRFVEMFGDPSEGEYRYSPKPIESICTAFVGGGTPSMKHPEYYGGAIPFIKSGDVKAKVITEGALTLTEEGLVNSSAKLIPKDSIVVVTRSGILKHTLPIAIAGCPVAINQDLKAITLQEGFLAQYVQWALLVSAPLILSKVRATTADNIETKLLKQFAIPVPPLELQQRFATFVAQVDKSRFVEHRLSQLYQGHLSLCGIIRVALRISSKGYEDGRHELRRVDALLQRVRRYPQGL